MNNRSIEKKYQEQCKHREFYADDDVPQQLICIDCGYSKIHKEFELSQSNKTYRFYSSWLL